MSRVTGQYKVYMNLKFVKNLYIKHLGMIIILLRKDMILEIYAITVYGFL